MKLTKQEIAQRDALAATLREREAELIAGIQTFNDDVSLAFEQNILWVQRAYNEALEATRAWAQDIASHYREVWDGRSETWQQSETGEQADTFVDAFDTYAPEDFYRSVPEPIDEPDGQAVEDFEGLPTSDDA